MWTIALFKGHGTIANGLTDIENESEKLLFLFNWS
jgi:hypothetical protein